MRAGPKPAITVPPLPTRGLPTDRAGRTAAWIERYCKVPRGHGAGKPVRLRDFQREIVAGAYAPGVRTALVSIPRANGKTALGAMLGLAEVFAGPASAECLVVASDQRQAEITLRLARRMVELNPALSDRVQVFRDRLYVPQNDALLLPLPAEPDALHGHDPSLLIVDELHVVTEEVWEAATTAAGKRPESLTLAISTPAASRDSVMWSLVEHGRAGDDPSFYLVEFGAPPGADPGDPAVWRAANPALADADPFLAEDALAAVRATTRASTFARLRLGMWTETESAWIGWESWAACADATRIVADRERVVLAFDGSASGDSTALIGCTVSPIGDTPHLFVVGLWENPKDLRWRVPRAEVDQAVAAAFDRFDVVELAADPWGWRSEIESWEARHGEARVLEWPTNVAGRMGPATDRMYQAVMAGTLTHDGDSRLAAHIGHCVARATPHGDLIVKDRKSSPRKIDAAGAALVAFDRAAYYAARSRPRSRVLSW